MVSTTEEITEPPQIVQELTQGVTGPGPVWHHPLYPEEPKLSTAPGSGRGAVPPRMLEEPVRHWVL